MCVRFARAREAIDYLAPLMSGGVQAAVPPDLRPSWNVVPGTWQPVIARGAAVRALYWGLPCHGARGAVAASWASGRRLRTIVDASAASAGSAAWQAVWSCNRVIVPADGWYEWLPAADGRQPYFIQRSDAEPLFIAALVVRAMDAPASNGWLYERFVLVASAAPAGAVDLHARQPAVLAVPDARAWLDADTPAAHAVSLAQDCALRASAFDRFPVTRTVNSAVCEDGPRLMERMAARM